MDCLEFFWEGAAKRSVSEKNLHGAQKLLTSQFAAA